MSNDSIQSWLNAAGRFPVLPKEEIIRLARKRDKCEPGSPAYVRVVNKICEHNLKLVPTVVRAYISKRLGLSMRSEVVGDLLQQGYIGLRRAAEKYDPSKGFALATYAYPWIKQAVVRWHNSHDRAIYVPENTMTEVLYIRRHGKRSPGRNGSKITERVIRAASHALEVGSIDRLANADEDATTLAEMMSDNNRIIDNGPDNSADRGILMLKDLMAECQIAPRTQDIVLAYARRGRMSIVASKFKISQGHCKNLHSEALQTMKAKIEEKRSARELLVADRLKGNKLTSERN